MRQDELAVLEAYIPEPFIVIVLTDDTDDPETVHATIGRGRLTREESIAAIIDIADKYKEQGYS